MKTYRNKEMRLKELDAWLIEKSKEKGFKPINISYSGVADICVLYEEGKK